MDRWCGVILIKKEELNGNEMGALASNTNNCTIQGYVVKLFVTNCMVKYLMMTLSFNF